MTATDDPRIQKLERQVAELQEFNRVLAQALHHFKTHPSQVGPGERLANAMEAPVYWVEERVKKKRGLFA